MRYDVKQLCHIYVFAFIIFLFHSMHVYAQTTCVSGGSDVQYISSTSDWSQINNTSKRLFCVAPGDYKNAGTIVITQDGTSGDRKILQLYNASNPNDTRHPAQIPTGEQALINSMRFSNANFWTVQRLTVDSDFDTSLSWLMEVRGTDNLFEDMLVEQIWHVGYIIIGNNSNNNIIRRNVIRETFIRVGDHVAIYMYAESGSPPSQSNTIIEDNEIYNTNQAIQIFHFPTTGVYPGTIIRNNDIYWTSRMYIPCAASACTEANTNPTAPCGIGEMLVVLKAGGTQANPARIYGNRFWGVRAPANVCGAPGGWGHAILVYGDSNYTLVDNNIIVDSARGVDFGGADSPNGNNRSAVDNLLYQIFDFSSNTGMALLTGQGSNTEMYRNTVVESTNWFIGTSAGTPNTDMRCNTLIDGGPPAGSLGTNSIYDYNFYFNSGRIQSPGTNDIVQATAALSNNASITFTRKRITGPEKFTIPYAIPTGASPHLDSCDPNLGSVANRGVDDRDWSLPKFDFSVSDNGDTNVTQGNSTTRIITASKTAGTQEYVYFNHALPLPTGVTISYSPEYCIPATSCQTTATINTTGSTPQGNHTIDFTGEFGSTVRASSLQLTVNASGGDTTAPVVEITSPTSNTTYSTATNPITTVAGTATDAVGTTSITWSNAATSGSGSGSGCSGETSCNWSVSSISLNEGSNAITITGADAAANEGTDVITVTLDTTAPSRSNGSPSGTLASGTTSTSLSLNTNETATCKYGTSAGVAYGSLPNTFSSTNSTSHSTTVGSLSDGNSYTYYVRCQDALSNANTDDFTISFSVAEAAVVTLGPPSALSTTHSSTVTMLTQPSTLSTTHSSTITALGQPSTLSTTHSSTVTVLGSPTGLSTP